MFIDADSRVPLQALPPAPSDEHELYIVWCGSEFVGLRWLGPRDLDTDVVEALVDEAMRRVDIPDGGMGARPDGRGATGIPSYFWLDGFGALPSVEVNELGVSVTITPTVLGVTWDFGDGTPPVSAGLGEAWPERSSVHHTYRDASPATRPYTVRAVVMIQPVVDVTGGDLAGPPPEPIPVTVQRTYAVRQVQAVRNH